MKRSLILKLSFLFVIASTLMLNGCSKDDDSSSKTDLLCRTWIWGEDEVLMRFQNDGTAVLNDGDTGTFYFQWRWDNKEETILVITSVRSGKVEKYIVAKISTEELVLKDDTGANQITIYAA